MDDQILIEIDTDKLVPHPDNPRKDLGDIAELTESVRKNGIMQNLTVIPGPDDDDFTVIIGHRRLAAAKSAGIERVPCRVIYNMDHKTQVSTMLEENMQRTDLTIYEQAQGFQMMLDLGETVETIKNKTGFSERTIQHRLNIAKLDQKSLKEKEQEDGFQLSLMDLYELEQVKDLKKRNSILKDANDSRQISYLARNAAKEEKEAENWKIYKKKFDALGYEQAPDKVANELYSGKWETLKEYDLDKPVTENIKVKSKKGDKILYLNKWSRTALLIRKAVKEEKKKSDYEIAREKTEEKKKQIKARQKKIWSEMKDFVMQIVSGKTEKIKNTDEVIREIWSLILHGYTYVSKYSAIEFYTNKEMYKASEDEKNDANEKFNNLSIEQQMMIVMISSLVPKNDELFDWNGKYSEEKGKLYLGLSNVLERYGFKFIDPEDQKIIDGSSELYVKEDKPAAALKR